MNNDYLKTPACSGRSMHQFAAVVSKEVDQSRATFAKFLNAGKKEEIILTRNTTEGINLVAHAFNFKPGDIVLGST